MADSTITFLVLAGAVIAFVSNRLPVPVVAVGVSLALWATDVLELEPALAGFGSPTVLFIAATFIVAEALDATGVVAWVGQQLLEKSGPSRTRVLVALMVVCALLTALITPNASVAALIPAVVVIALRTSTHSSQLLMPLAFGAHAGSMLAFTGTPVNILVADAIEDAGLREVGFFEFAWFGIPLLIGTVAITVLMGSKLLPQRSGESMPPDFSRLAEALAADYGIDGNGEGLYDRQRGVAELVIPPRSDLIGKRAFIGMVAADGLILLGVQREGRRLEVADVTLAAGDALLVRGTWKALERNLPGDDVVMVDDPAHVRRQVVALGAGAKQALVVLAAMVVLLATNAVPAAVAGLLAAGALILMGIVPMDRAFRSISWTTITLVAGMIPLATAMQESGAAQKLADGLVDLVGDSSPHVLAAGLFVLVAILGQLISNTATALIVIPIAVTAAAELDVSARPLLMAVNIAAAASLLTPVATPANTMVLEPGGYRFGDYWKLGLPIMVWYGVIGIFWVPVVWPF